MFYQNYDLTDEERAIVKGISTFILNIKGII